MTQQLLLALLPSIHQQSQGRIGEISTLCVVTDWTV